MVMSVFLVSSYMLLAGSHWNLLSFLRYGIRFLIIGVGGMALLISLAFAVAPRIVPGGAFVTLERVRSLARYGNLTDNDALGSRLEHQKAYLHQISERPVIGYGMGSAPEMRDRKLLKRSSHNTFVEHTLMYGAVGLVVWLAVIWVTWRDCYALRRVIDHKIDVIFFGTVFLACMVSSTVLANRILYVVIGWLLAERYPYPRNTDED